MTRPHPFSLPPFPTKSIYLFIRVDDGIIFRGVAHNLDTQYAMSGPGVSDVGQTVDWGAGKHDVHVKQYAQDHESLQWRRT